VSETPEPAILTAAFKGLCPRCGERTLFEAPARVALKCSSCELDLGALERGGRLGGVLTALVAIVLILIAYAIEATLRPPLWLQAAFWAPVTVGVVIFALRFFKTMLLYAGYERLEDKGE
jgi:uncharacterized protein (DUF983 family)